MEVHALRQRGWSISAIARHLGRDRKTVRAYLFGERVPGERAPAEADPFDPFEVYVRQRLSDDPHVWASALFDEVAALGYSQSYPTLVRKIRHRRLRPFCGACAGTRVVLQRLSIIHRVRRSSGTGQNSGTPPGGPEPVCWLVSCRTRALFALGSLRVRTSHTWLRE